MRKIALSAVALSTLTTMPLIAQEYAASAAEPVLSGGNTAWVLAATAMVMFMTMPALGLFYGGLVRKKNVLSILMQSFISIALVSVIWVTFGYSLAFSDTELIPGVLGDFKWAFFNGIATSDLSPYYISDSIGRIPHILYAMFQCMFAVITPALIIGAFAERMKFSSFLAFTVAWLVLIYIPLAHMVWSSNGWLYKLGALDFAGGTVVHINAGFAALATALYLGKRSYLKPFPPHNLPFAVIGAGMLWFGWFGFNGGSSLAADGLAANAVMTTNTAAATAALIWALFDKLVNGKVTVLGVATGAVVGLVSVTPAAGFVTVTGALAIGAAGSAVCFFMVSFVKEKFGYDDSLDAFGCHGMGGLVGALLTGVFADPVVWKGFGGNYSGLAYGNPKQLGIQALTSLVSIALAFLGTLVILKVVDLFLGIRVDPKTEAIGLDITQHNERAYTVIE
ncbi:MAG: ammonia channel protein [Treponema sp. GWB1_62_6]|nr:MAG: ammonia channel protein [Treponema sp. GWA1_62_8]OHE66600.1 MAG: ammonia channel protein [Treponema sp. GWC1_61_84]OHE67656.1 MAG: ammonia channel protein [Treponema sp. GWB1_62_6]OHE72285.1 MAG: ammonia channel protein [Treponema sp. RIFOXYC1_FULL_61_9]HCM28274.1 ammonia channel protein [Treponema sp.]